MQNINGILLVNKPEGWTSFDVVAKVRGIIRAETKQTIKIGHTGTLDPFATGLLILVLGSYCKRASEFSGLDKTYKVAMKLGKTSTTGDIEGLLTNTSTKQPANEEVIKVIDSFVGNLSQVPPAYSAVKVNGQRAYKLARQGKEVQLEPRNVTIHSIELINYSYPDIEFAVWVSSGTYIRSLVVDIGQKLGTGAYTTILRRTSVGDFSINDATAVADLSVSKINEQLQTIAKNG